GADVFADLSGATPFRPVERLSSIRWLAVQKLPFADVKIRLASAFWRCRCRKHLLGASVSDVQFDDRGWPCVWTDAGRVPLQRLIALLTGFPQGEVTPECRKGSITLGGYPREVSSCSRETTGDEIRVSSVCESSKILRLQAHCFAEIGESPLRHSFDKISPAPIVIGVRIVRLQSNCLI